MDLLRAVKLECCEAGSRAKDKTDILRQLARLTCRAASFEHIDPESIYTALSEREAKAGRYTRCETEPQPTTPTFTLFTQWLLF